MTRAWGALVLAAVLLACCVAWACANDLVAATTDCAASTAVQDEEAEIPIDPNGYILYCPCMGRLGNQMAHLLGAVHFARLNNRTLVVPPFIEYHATPRFIPFDDHFDISELTKAHRVVTMERFMEKIAPRVWPSGPARRAHCFVNQGETARCNSKEGSPFGPFWNHFGIDFASDAGLQPIYTAHPDLAPPAHPVVALRGAPADFPVLPANRHLQQYVVWNAKRTSIARAFIETHLARPFVAAHARSGADWVSACKIGYGMTSFMENAQCNFTAVSPATCIPSVDEMAPTILAAARRASAAHVLLGCDDETVCNQLAATIQRSAPSLLVRFAARDPFLTVHLFSLADIFVGNCVSSFTAIAARERVAAGKPVWYFGKADTHV